MIELRHLRTLTTLRETGSLAAAAERLHLTQSALSHQMADLEERLGLSLFVRKTRPLRFSNAGERLLALADQFLPAVSLAERDLRRLAGGETGRLRMAIECHSCFQWLMPALDSYRAHWPSVELDFVTAFSFAPLPALRRGDVDLVITADPEPQTGIAYRPLFRFEMLLAVAPEHPLARRTLVSPEDLSTEILITYPVDRNRLDVFRSFLEPVGAEPAGVRHSESTLMMMQLVASRRGVCALPSWALAEYLDRNHVVACRMGPDGLWSTLYAAYRAEQDDAPFLQAFLDTARDISFSSLRGISAALPTEATISDIGGNRPVSA